MKRGLFTFLLFVIMIRFIFSPLLVQAEEDNRINNEFTETLYAQAAVLMDADSGRILYGKNEKELLPMASTTKIMTCIVTLENADLDDLVTISGYAQSMPKVKLNVRKGEQYKLEDLLFSLMLESHNDSAVAIAEHVGGSIEAFSNLMNQKAREIGCNDTFFITPNGLDATAKVTRGNEKIEVQHATTALELAKIMSYCILRSPKSEEFLRITQTREYQFHNKKEQDNGTVTDGARNFSCRNHNAFLDMMEGALSGKTGFTGKAGYCYVGSLKQDERVFVVALLGCGWPNHKTYKWIDTRKLMQYGLEHYRYVPLKSLQIEEEKIERILIQSAKTRKIGEELRVSPVICEEESNIKGILLKDGEKFNASYHIKKSLEAPIERNTEIGTIEFSLNNQVWKKYKVLIPDTIEKIDYSWTLQQCFNKWKQFNSR